MFDYYIYYFGPNKTKPALYRVPIEDKRITYAELTPKVLIFSISSNEKEDVIGGNSFYKLQ